MTADGTEYEGTSFLQRVRSTVLLAALVVTLGAITAVTLGVVIVGATSLINHALG